MNKLLKKSLKDLFIKGYTINLDWKKTPSAFAFSTGRTGTNFIADLFSNISTYTLALHEPGPDLFDLSVGRYRIGFENSEVAQQIKKKRRNQLYLMKKLNKSLYFESNPNLTFISDVLPSVFEESKYIIITRYYKDYILSAFNKSPDGTGHFYPYGEGDHRKRINPFDFNDKEYMSKWSSMHQAEKLAWFYKTANEFLLKHWYDRPNVLWLKFEDIFHSNSGIEEIEKTLSFLDIDYSEKVDEIERLLLSKVNDNRTLRTESYNQFPYEVKESIDDIVRPIVKKLQELNLLR